MKIRNDAFKRIRAGKPAFTAEYRREWPEDAAALDGYTAQDATDYLDVYAAATRDQRSQLDSMELPKAIAFCRKAAVVLRNQ